MYTTAETETELQELSDPELIKAWAAARARLALGSGSKAAYEAARAEYLRRMGRAS